MRCSGGLRKTADRPRFHLQELGFFPWSPEAETLDLSGSASPGFPPDWGDLALREPNASFREAENPRASGAGHQRSSRSARSRKPRLCSPAELSPVGLPQNRPRP